MWGIQHAQLSFRAGKGFELVDRSADGPNLSYAEGSKPYADLGVRELRASALRGRGGLSLTGEGNLAVRASGGVTVFRDGTGNGDLTVQGNAWVNGNLTLPNWSWINGGTRLHIGGPERLHLLNAAGVYVGFGGVAGNDSGCLWVENRSSFGGDMRVTGKMVVGPATPKQFAIDHPLDPPDATERRQLIHAALEGPENGVYYRGEGRPTDGAATVELPAYFEALTRAEGRTVHLTPVFDDDELVCPLAAGRVRDGRFRVRTVDGSPATHAFYWR
ncbi:hypothetical protein ABZ783_08875 [Micromonospora sp. NPDC047738]|uniref:hypothetical protein n=1 Tax=Micromonospora sp. NPDC047738 TaxID=3155741 RepID=UPI0033FFF6B6